MMKDQEKIKDMEVLLEQATYKIEGLKSDLHEAVGVAYNHGAKTWVKLNYPAFKPTPKKGL